MSELEVQRRGGAMVLTLNDPKRRNILSAELCKLIISAVAAANADPDIRALIVTGAAPAFCAGADLTDLQAASTGETDALHLVYAAFMDIANSPLPTIAAVNGAAVGAGFNLALACDVRIASEDALFDTRFLKIGLHPGGGHGWLLERAVGWAEATRLLLFSQRVRSQEAYRIGLVQEVTPAEALMDRALEMAGGAADVPRELLLRTKASLRHAVTADHASAMKHETGEQLWSLQQPAFAQLVSSLQATIKSNR